MIDEKRSNKKQKNTHAKEQRGDANYSECVRAK